MTKVNKNGKYFVLEGIDGSGKSTQHQLLVDYLKGLSLPVESLREPGGTSIGEAVRQILLGGLDRSMETNLDLFTISRRELVAQKIGPLTLAGVNVIGDRNWISSVAYQGFGEGMELEKIIDKSRDAMGDFFIPDGVVILETSIETVAERIGRRSTAKDHFETKDKEFFTRVLSGYRWVAANFKIPILDAEQTVEKVHQDVIKCFEPLILK